MKLLPDGRRQIFGFLLPNEVVELPPPDSVDHQIVALTRVEVVDWAAARGDLSPQTAAAWEQTERDRAHRLFDQILRLGTLNAEERLLNLLLDLLHRLNAAGLVRNDTLKLPLTQELLADALGLSVVHINRTMRKLRASGCITSRDRAITLHQPQQLALVACYQPQVKRTAHAA